MQVSLIQVPYMVGDDRHSDSDGTQHLLQNGAANIFTSNGFTVSVDQVERGTAYRDSATSSLAVNKNLKKTVQRAVVAEQVPIVLAGSCDVSAGILAGFDHSRCGVVWLDAHGDFNTPESTISGFFAGMSLAVITGHCYRSYWAQIGDNTPVLESATVIFGVRDLDPAEQQRFQQSQIRMVKWRDGNPQGNVQTILDDLSKRVHEFYLHIDLDALDPEIAPGIVDDPVPGGLSLHQMEDLIRAMCCRLRLRAAALTTYNPGRDHDGKTLRVSLRVLEVLAEFTRAS